MVGLCLAARDTDYVKAAMNAWGGNGGSGECSVIGHGAKMDAAGAAFVNGTAAHGEDYDDTFEGTPVHTGAVALPAVLAACEVNHRSSDDLIKGIAVAAELMCRMALVQPTDQHKAGFHEQVFAMSGVHSRGPQLMANEPAGKAIYRRYYDAAVSRRQQGEQSKVSPSESVAEVPSAGRTAPWVTL